MVCDWVLAISEVKRCNICNIAANLENTGLENAAAIATSATLERNRLLRDDIHKIQRCIMTKDQFEAIKEFNGYIYSREYDSPTHKEKMQYLFLLQVMISYMHGLECVASATQ